jgi:hypothetical protein
MSITAAATFAAACSVLDHTNFETFDRFWEPLYIALIVTCLLMPISGFIWSRAGKRSSVIRIAILNVFTPIILVVLLSLVGLVPNVHGSFGLFFLFEFFSLITMGVMLLGALFRKADANAGRK